MVMHLDSLGPEPERACSIELDKYAESQEMGHIHREMLISKDQGTRYNCRVQRSKNVVNSKASHKEGTKQRWQQANMTAEVESSLDYALKIMEQYL